MYEELIDYFHKGIKTNEEVEKVDFAKINAKAVLCGYIIHPDCCNSAVMNWINTLTTDYNATFYKEWKDILNQSRFELFVDQLLHYATTYGTDFSLGNGYVPNEGSNAPSFKELKLIEPIEESDLFDKCLDVLKSGIALKDSTMKNMADFVEFYAKKNGFDEKSTVDIIDGIKNKECQAYIAMKFGMMPTDEFGILRCLVYSHTGNCLLIKSSDYINSIRLTSRDFGEKSPVLKLEGWQIERLSRIFYRYKPIFLAMKNDANGFVINRLRRLAKKNHRPFQIGFWEGIVSNKRPITEVCEKLAELDNFRKIRLLMLIKERIMFKTETGVFPIRNGKLFVRENYNPKYDLEYLGSLYLAIKASLVNSLKTKACKVKVPENIDLKLPTSEKTFVGNFPYGSSFRMDQDNIVGVYWRNEWGTRDYDLSMVDMFGRLISWRGQYSCGNSIVFSGDMTNANPCATELIYFNKEAPDGIIQLNKFNGDDNSKFRLFYASENLNGKLGNLLNYMVDPNDVKFDTLIEFNGQGQKTVGIIFDNEFFFMDFESGRNRASSGGKYVQTIVDAMKRKAKCFISLKDILLEAGFTFVQDESETPDIDFTNLEKDTFVKLLS